MDQDDLILIAKEVVKLQPKSGPDFVLWGMVLVALGGIVWLLWRNLTQTRIELLAAKNDSLVQQKGMMQDMHVVVQNNTVALNSFANQLEVHGDILKEHTQKIETFLGRPPRGGSRVV